MSSIQLFINAGNSLNVLLSLLFRAMVIHGHYPRNLLVSTIISIPKDLKSSLCNVDNYRGISLFNSIAKVFDYVFIELCNNQLIATDMHREINNRCYSSWWNYTKKIIQLHFAA